jgi:5-methyltetrahydrofolate--homocysteine methyltransferase
MNNMASNITDTDNYQLLRELLDRRILVLDGAMGTMIQQANLAAADFGGAELEGCNEHLVLSRPDVIREIHRQYFAAGADIVETDTFGATPLVLAEYGLADRYREINIAAVKLAREAAAEFSTPNKVRFVAGSMGPTTKAITVTGGVTFQQLVENFQKQAAALIEGGVDMLLVETCQDTRNVKAALIGIEQASHDTGRRAPVIVSGTIEPMGTMLAGQTADALVASLQHVDLLAIGLNCATGPEFMTDHIRTIHEMATTAVSCYPNAGLPDEEGRYGETPTSLAASLDRFVKNGWLNLVGGCCGTTPAHIKAIVEMVDDRAPRRYRGRRRSYYSGIELVEACDDTRPLIVGERTNEVGSRAFKRLISEEQFEEATEIARAQVKNGAHIIDINLENTDRDELADIDRFYEKAIHKVKVPLMIDSTNPAAVERALTYCQGKAIINSINFEDGDEKFLKVLPLAKKYGAAIIIGSIDEDKQQAQAITRERKLAIAERAHRYCTAHGMAEEDLIFDPLTFPCATGDENYIGSAVETVEAIRLIKQRLPRCKTVLGVSNVSFGLPPAAREVVNSVMLYHATRAGLDLAIVNAEKLERYASIPELEKKLAEDVLFHALDRESSQRAIAAISEHFREATSRIQKKTSDLSLDERLAQYIIEGTKDGLVADLDRKLKDTAPLDIINGPLMTGMNEVGRLFNNNELIVAEVLQSAEAMKAAVAHLEQFMEHAESATKGRVLLATVKGDVHDIGKNLVEIILANNGYKVINLGIKVPPEELIRAYREHEPDAIGLSGLLVKSAQQMTITAGDLKTAGINVPLLVGGAALSDKFTRTKIAPSYGAVVLYCKDAMTGLAAMNGLMSGAAIHADEGRTGPAPAADAAVVLPAETTTRSSRVRSVPPVPPPYRDRRKLTVPNLPEIWSYINPQMLYVRHLGYRTNFENALAARDPKALELFHAVEEVKADAGKFMNVRVLWRFYDAEAEGNSIRLFVHHGDTGGVTENDGKTEHTFTFPRQRKEDGLCLADYVMAGGDSVGVLVTTAGEGVREHAEAYKQAGQFLKSHALQALALETAEAAAEWVHRRIREDWGFADPAEMTMIQRFQARYRGKRYSFGYPACPALEDQEGIWKLLQPADIGVNLTEGYMMEPEASVSALVFHHPDALYFTVGETLG